MICKTNYDSPLGKITLACYANNIIGLWLENQKYFGDTVSEEMIENNNLEIFNLTKNWLDRYFAGEKPPISEIPIAPIGNEFRQTVWTILCEIPYGEVTTYRDIANKIAKQRGIEKMSAQAVGGAVGHNPIPIIIPCHRVVGKNGSLTGYSGGIKNKIKLLKLEKADLTKFFVPKNSTAP